MLVDTGVVTCTDVSVCRATCQRLPLGDIVPSPEWASGSGRGALRTHILAPRRGSMPVGTGLRAVATGPIPVGMLPEAGPPHGRTALPGRPGGGREWGRRPDGCPRALGSLFRRGRRAGRQRRQSGHGPARNGLRPDTKVAAMLPMTATCIRRGLTPPTPQSPLRSRGQ